MKKAYCFDLDGTITSKEILPEIGKLMNKYEELSLLTTQTLQGEVMFEDSFRTRVDILKDLPISVVREIISKIPVYPDIVNFISDHNKDCFIITGNLDVWVAELVDSWECNLLSSKAYYRDDKLLGVDRIINKGIEVVKLQESYDKVIAIGDGIADAEMLSNADVGIAFGATHSPVSSVIKSANYVVYEPDTLCTLLKTL